MNRSGLRVLLTNNTLAARNGSELYVRDLALALMRRGHFPVVYSTILGDVADELRAATVPVVDDVGALTIAPDLIHGQHHLDAMTAMLQFPQVPAVYVCHGWLPWEEWPPVFPSIRRYVAVDDLCRERLLTTPGIAPEQIDVHYNFVDLDRFRRRDLLPAVPASALIFSNAASEGSFVPTIREACQAFGIARVDVAGSAYGNSIAAPEQVLGGYDVVFGKGRCALEAMAVGCATVVADFIGLAGMVDTGNMQQLRRLNFGVRTMQAGAITRDGVLSALRAYNPADARQVTEWIRSEVDLAAAADRWLTTYDQAINALPSAVGEHAIEKSLRAASAYLRRLAPVLKTRGEAEARAQQAGEAARVAEAGRVQTGSELARVETQLADVRAQLARSEQRTAALSAELGRLQRELEVLHGSRAWRAISRYRKLRAWL